MEENKESIREALVSDTNDQKSKFLAVQNLKKFFRPPDKIFSRLKLTPLLQSARIPLESKPREKHFLFSYGTSLLQNIGRDATLDLEIFDQLEYILTQLKKEDETLTNELVTKLWSKLENGSIFNRDGFLSASKEVIEWTVLDLVVTTDNTQKEFLVRMTADSPKLFQTVTTVFYEVLLRTKGLQKVLDVLESFVLSVKQFCRREGKTFYGLYPKDCQRLANLMSVPPQVYEQEREDIFDNIVSLWLEMFWSDRRRALKLMSHYPDWLSVIKFDLEKNEI